MTLTPEEYQDSKDQKFTDLKVLSGFLNQKLMNLKDHYDKAIFLKEDFTDIQNLCTQFYELTYLRDQAFISNMLEVIEDTPYPAMGDTEPGRPFTRSEELHEDKWAGAVAGPVAAHQYILITGGYHTPNLKYLLKQKNISYISLIPQVTQETNVKRYEEILLNQPIPGRTTFQSQPLSQKVMMDHPFMAPNAVKSQFSSTFLNRFRILEKANPLLLAPARLAQEPTAEPSAEMMPGSTRDPNKNIFNRFGWKKLIAVTLLLILPLAASYFFFYKPDKPSNISAIRNEIKQTDKKEHRAVVIHGWEARLGGYVNLPGDDYMGAWLKKMYLKVDLARLMLGDLGIEESDIQESSFITSPNNGGPYIIVVLKDGRRFYFDINEVYLITDLAIQYFSRLKNVEPSRLDARVITEESGGRSGSLIISPIAIEVYPKEGNIIDGFPIEIGFQTFNLMPGTAPQGARLAQNKKKGVSSDKGSGGLLSRRNLIMISVVGLGSLAYKYFSPKKPWENIRMKDSGDLEGAREDVQAAIEWLKAENFPEWMEKQGYRDFTIKLDNYQKAMMKMNSMENSSNHAIFLKLNGRDGTTEISANLANLYKILRDSYEADKHQLYIILAMALAREAWGYSIVRLDRTIKETARLDATADRIFYSAGESFEDGFNYPSKSASEFLSKHADDLQLLISFLISGEIGEGVAQITALEWATENNFLNPQANLVGLSGSSKGVWEQFQHYQEYTKFDVNKKVSAIAREEFLTALSGNYSAFLNGNHSGPPFLYFFYVHSQMELYQKTKGKRGIDPSVILERRKPEKSHTENAFLDLVPLLIKHFKEIGVPGVISRSIEIGNSKFMADINSSDLFPNLLFPAPLLPKSLGKITIAGMSFSEASDSAKTPPAARLASEDNHFSRRDASGFSLHLDPRQINVAASLEEIEWEAEYFGRSYEVLARAAKAGLSRLGEGARRTEAQAARLAGGHLSRRGALQAVAAATGTSMLPAGSSIAQQRDADVRSKVSLEIVGRGIVRVNKDTNPKYWYEYNPQRHSVTIFSTAQSVDYRTGEPSGPILKNQRAFTYHSAAPAHASSYVKSLQEMIRFVRVILTGFDSPEQINQANEAIGILSQELDRPGSRGSSDVPSNVSLDITPDGNIRVNKDTNPEYWYEYNPTERSVTIFTTMEIVNPATGISTGQKVQNVRAFTYFSTRPTHASSYAKSLQEMIDTLELFLMDPNLDQSQKSKAFDAIFTLESALPSVAARLAEKPEKPIDIETFAATRVLTERVLRAIYPGLNIDRNDRTQMIEKSAANERLAYAFMSRELAKMRPELAEPVSRAIWGGPVVENGPSFSLTREKNPLVQPTRKVALKRILKALEDDDRTKPIGFAEQLLSAYGSHAPDKGHKEGLLSKFIQLYAIEKGLEAAIDLIEEGQKDEGADGSINLLVGAHRELKEIRLQKKAVLALFKGKYASIERHEINTRQDRQAFIRASAIARELTGELFNPFLEISEELFFVEDHDGGDEQDQNLNHWKVLLNKAFTSSDIEYAVRRELNFAQAYFKLPYSTNNLSSDEEEFLTEQLSRIESIEPIHEDDDVEVRDDIELFMYITDEVLALVDQKRHELPIVPLFAIYEDVWDSLSVQHPNHLRYVAQGLLSNKNLLYDESISIPLGHWASFVEVGSKIANAIGDEDDFIENWKYLALMLLQRSQKSDEDLGAARLAEETVGESRVEGREPNAARLAGSTVSEPKISPLISIYALPQPTLRGLPIDQNDRLNFTLQAHDARGRKERDEKEIFTLLNDDGTLTTVEILDYNAATKTLTILFDGTKRVTVEHYDRILERRRHRQASGKDTLVLSRAELTLVDVRIEFSEETAKAQSILGEVRTTKTKVVIWKLDGFLNQKSPEAIRLFSHWLVHALHKASKANNTLFILEGSREEEELLADIIDKASAWYPKEKFIYLNAKTLPANLLDAQGTLLPSVKRASVMTVDSQSRATFKRAENTLYLFAESVGEHHVFNLDALTAGGILLAETGSENIAANSVELERIRRFYDALHVEINSDEMTLFSQFIQGLQITTTRWFLKPINFNQIAVLSMLARMAEQSA